MLTPQIRKNQKNTFKNRTIPQNLNPKTLEELQIIEEWRSSKEDKGSVDVEIGLLSEKISRLEERLQNSPRIERHQLRLKLVAYVHSRRQKLNYLLSTDTSRYYKALDRLKISA